MAWPPLKDRLLSLLDPGYLLYGGARGRSENGELVHYPSGSAFFIHAFRAFILSGNLPTSLRFKQVRDDAFSDFWTKVTAPIDPPPPPAGSATLVPPILSRAHGVVLDIGPGSGSHVSCFSDNANITAIYGAEPTLGLHAPLQQRIDEAKLTDKYHVLGCTADKKELLSALEKQGGVKQLSSDRGTFDTIVCVRVLCSVPNLDEAARELYSLLRPGGELMVVEHIRNPWTKNGSVLGRSMQILYTVLGWTFFLAGCEMGRDTASSLRKAGRWEAVELKTNFEWSALPYLSGTLTKVK
ncbi:hypothetical protein LTR96_007271 [Exophiala xenobiotica]|uniref:S-adenosyl-L-methionine-dependent methyltransferase n=1 Tax=Vermiconidia calcicola TaxID=1690605 RepID=A0AAV9Q7E8_9PEZI|nr:hypothetical protein LTR96_007271 [Exophiala xenobiotica]KAK5334977.1 hypothetical protein LTR98_008697 [Exophiala xenobiotica]KAK5537594.1 hypothetical protein LTR25_004846 [Vermiconidia calcicola]